MCESLLPPHARTQSRALAALTFIDGWAGPEGDTAEAEAELSDYASGARTAPLPTYFVGGYGRGASALLAALDASGAAGDVHYLGRAGLRNLAGLAVAFLDGRYDPAAFAGAGAERQGSCRHFTQACL